MTRVIISDEDHPTRAHSVEKCAQGAETLKLDSEQIAIALILDF